MLLAGEGATISSSDYDIVTHLNSCAAAGDGSPAVMIQMIADTNLSQPQLLRDRTKQLRQMDIDCLCLYDHRNHFQPGQTSEQMVDIMNMSTQSMVICLRCLLY